MRGKLRLVITVIMLAALFSTAATISMAASSVKMKAVDSGAYANFALAEDGTVWAWGNNRDGQMGIGDKSTIYVPFQIPGLTGVKALSADATFTLLLKGDGTVWAAGKNDHGQLGDGTMTDRSSFAQVKGLSNIVAIDAKDSVGMALKDDGTVWVWGYYSYGSGANNKNVTVPEIVPGLANIKAISAGNWHYLVVDKDGNAWAWGNNLNGQIGIGSYAAQPTPVKVTGLSGVKDVAAGYQFSLFLKEDGTVWACGWNNQGVLGTGTSGSKVPVQVPGLSGIIDVAASSETAAALKDDGTIYVWGNYYPSAMSLSVAGPPINTPTALTAITGAKAISADFKAPVLALNQNGTVWGIGGLSYRDPETGYLAESGKATQIKFIGSASTAVPTATAAPTAGSATTGTQTPSTPLLLAIGVFCIAAILRAGKK
ncbi:hypothetical protein MCP_1625 [Methanocella paludicola SANAE]|uniref:Uncharacterized protein n=2 Tax=Methanocella TaxID=570266 RepID=D1YZ25_METPS|nr:hypothetical protein MCP_1625 [Methanocella paludicola SANAE]